MGFFRKLFYLATVSAVTYYFFFPWGQPYPSDLIVQAIEDTVFIQQVKTQLKEFMEQESTFDNLVANSVRPAADRVASVRKQTEIYEGMERIKGGPQNFMETSLAILEETLTDLLNWEKKYRLATAKVQKQWPKLAEMISQVDQKLQFLHSEEFFETLNQFQIHFQPVDYEDPEMKRQADKKLSLPMEVILDNAATKLLPLIRKFEEIKTKEGKPPKVEKEDFVKPGPELLQVWMELITHLKSFGVSYNQLGVYWLQLKKDITSASGTALERVERSKTRYEDLADGIDKDITTLRERIRNLGKSGGIRKNPNAEL